VNLEGFYDGEGRFRSRMILEGFRILECFLGLL
jgi:hypothetical protein